jgi:thiol:disulfide interchange protein DsbG
MKLRHLALPLVASLALLTACSKEAPTSEADVTPIAATQALDVLAAQGKGFTAGALMAANPVYVLFDPQCPHCGHLWESSLPLHGKVKFVWLPVSLLNAKSTPQGAAILTASNPVEAMTTHEKSLLANQGGISASSSVAPEVEAVIKANTALLDRLGATSVPFVVARNQRTGAVVTAAGAMSTETLTGFLGLAQP